MLHPVLPDIEIGLSKTTIALMFFPDGIIKPYKINPKGKYFVLNESRARGIYTINKKYCWVWGAKTQCYFYMIQETNPIDPIRIHELNEFKERNKLTKITQKDIKHAAMLRTMENRIIKADSFPTIDETVHDEGKKIDEEITNKLKEV